MPGIAIIIGAGASWDCANASTGRINDAFRPPLVGELFQNRNGFNDILNKYPKARALSGRIRDGLAAGRGLEDILREISQAPQETSRSQYFQVPLYLQELLGEVSAHFISAGGSKFDTMVAALDESGYDNILYVTLNYDIFMERALRDRYDVRFRDINDYCPDGRDWALIKLHGSVTWGQRLLNGSITNPGSPFEMTMEGEPQLDDKVIVLRGYAGRERIKDDAFYYPSLAVPLGVKDLACPESHVRTMLRRIEDCSTILMVGFSALDQHILENFKRFKGVTRIGIVNEDAVRAREVLKRCRPYNACFKVVVPDEVIFDRGFGDFVSSGKLRTFLSVTP